MTVAVGSRKRPLDANDISLDGQRFLAAVHPEPVGDAGDLVGEVANERC